MEYIAEQAKGQDQMPAQHGLDGSSLLSTENEPTCETLSILDIQGISCNQQQKPKTYGFRSTHFYKNVNLRTRIELGHYRGIKSLLEMHGHLY